MAHLPKPCAVLLAAVLLLPWTGTAQANPFPGIDTVADSSTHTFCLHASYVTDPSVATYAMDVLDDTTDLSDVQGACLASTDVWWYEANLPALLQYGEYYCVTLVSPGVCNSADVLMDFPAIDLDAFDWYDRRQTAVHEIGHSVGLAHDNISAMKTGQANSVLVQWRRFSAHDIGHINAHY
jgi:hypothetical protein